MSKSSLHMICFHVDVFLNTNLVFRAPFKGCQRKLGMALLGPEEFDSMLDSIILNCVPTLLLAIIEFLLLHIHR